MLYVSEVGLGMDELEIFLVPDIHRPISQPELGTFPDLSGKHATPE